MRTTLIFVIFLAFGNTVHATIELARNGKTDHRIVIATDADPQTRAAAAELALHLHRITGAVFPTIHDEAGRPDKAIFVGPSRHLVDLGVRKTKTSLGTEGFQIQTLNNDLVILGAGRRGILNGVWDFLERELGCRWFTPTLTVTPPRRHLVIDAVDRHYIPPFEVRTIWIHNAEHEGVHWPARMRLNCFSRHIRDWEQHIHHPLLDGGWYWAEHESHTFPRFVSSEEHYETHPEYFSLVGGKRIQRDGQLCMTHPDVATLASRWAQGVLAHDPRARLVSISPADLGNFCQCERCTATRHRYPSLVQQEACGNAPMLLAMVNRVARQMKVTHPHALVSTLSYQHTRIPDHAMQVEENAVIRYCPIEACTLHAIDDADCAWNQRNYEGTRFAKELATWTTVAPRVWIWYYAFDRGGSLAISPWRSVMQSNLRLFHRLGVKGVQVQGRISPIGPWAAFHDLKAYLFAKLLWNPRYDVEEGTREFCTAFYGAAGDHILDFLDALHDPATYTDSVAAYLNALPGRHLPVGGQPASIRPKLFDTFTQWFDEAEQGVHHDPVMLRRVTAARLTLQYMVLHQLDPSNPLYRRARLRFFDTARRVGLVKILDPETDKVVDVDAWETTVRGKG